MVETTWPSSVLMIEAAAIGMATALVMNVMESFRVSAPVFPNEFNQRFLAVATWGFVVPFYGGLTQLSGFLRVAGPDQFRVAHRSP